MEGRGRRHAIGDLERRPDWNLEEIEPETGHQQEKTRGGSVRVDSIFCL